MKDPYRYRYTPFERRALQRRVGQRITLLYHELMRGVVTRVEGLRVWVSWDTNSRRFPPENGWKWENGLPPEAAWSSFSYHASHTVPA